MLGKLIKHDFISMGRFLLPLYLGVLVLSLITSGSIKIQDLMNGTSMDAGVMGKILGVFLVLMVVGGIIALSCAAFLAIVVIFRRYYMNLFSDEGYLTFTLPITTDQILISKTITAGVAIIASGIVAVIGVFLMMLISIGPAQFVSGFEGFHFEYVRQFFIECRAGGLHPWLYIITAILSALGTLVAQILQVFLALTIGSIIASKHKILASIGVYLGINVVVGIITSVMIGVSVGAVTNTVEYYASNAAYGGFIETTMLIYLAFELAISAAFYFINRYYLKRKMNLV